VLYLFVDFVVLDVDFVVFFGYKMLGLFGVGVLWGCSELLNVMLFFFMGGLMIEVVCMEGLMYGLCFDLCIGCLIVLFVI